ncbi:hypothetical protein [Vibrio sp. ER1A]|jgi:sulfur carrier protein ThiS|uniref:hypothetical protein n=1 Tax=Vibrio sp. ER1A TaxID=1517681 RepID=UPI0004DD2851|nr:hypothetical protein [Vibrio sp. ER1A]KFA96685.1 hypothetical protein HW45_18915 [Vibrio sp. ER1A]
MEHFILLCNLELSLMVLNAKQKYIAVSVEDSASCFEAIDIALDLGNRNVPLSARTLEVLEHIKSLDINVYESFVYAYNGAVSLHGHYEDEIFQED